MKAPASSDMNIHGSKEYIKRRRAKLGDKDYETEDMESAVHESEELKKKRRKKANSGGIAEDIFKR